MHIGNLQATLLFAGFLILNFDLPLTTVATPLRTGTGSSSSSSSSSAFALSLLDLEEFAGLQGACSCKWPPKNPAKGNGKCAPQPALCGYCQQAVFSVTQGGGAGSGCSTATDAGMEACEKIAEMVDKKQSKIQKFYEERLQSFGPGGGWSLEFCLTLKCCAQ